MRGQGTPQGIAAIFVACLLNLTLSAQDPKPDATAETKARISQLFTLGNSYLAEKKHDQAIDTYRELLKLEPLHPSGQHNLGVALANTRRHQEALEAFLRSL